MLPLRSWPIVLLNEHLTNLPIQKTAFSANLSLNMPCNKKTSKFLKKIKKILMLFPFWKIQSKIFFSQTLYWDKLLILRKSLCYYLIAIGIHNILIYTEIYNDLWLYLAYGFINLFKLSNWLCKLIIFLWLIFRKTIIGKFLTKSKSDFTIYHREIRIS